MRRGAFIAMIVGMFVLLLLLNLPAKEIKSYEEIESLEINTRVKVSGSVVSEKVIYENEKVLELDRGITLVFEGIGQFTGKEIEAVGKISEYEGKKQVTVEKIVVLR